VDDQGVEIRPNDIPENQDQDVKDAYFRRRALKSPHLVGLFCPYSRSLLTIVWSAQAHLQLHPLCLLLLAPWRHYVPGTN
jgi:hypothetical protein